MLLNYRLLFVVVAVCVLWAEQAGGQQGNPRRRRPGARRPGRPRMRVGQPNATGTPNDGEGGGGPTGTRPQAGRQGIRRTGPGARRPGTGPGARRPGTGPGARRPGFRRPGTGPGARRQGTGPNAGRQGAGPNAGRQGAGPNAGRQGAGPNAGRQGAGPNAGRQGAGPNAGRQGAGPNAGRQGARQPSGGPGTGGSGPFCQKIMVPMCKGQVGYEYTRLPNQYGHRTQNDVMEALEPFWPFMDMDCSPNFRLTACSAYLPKCVERRRLVMPPCRQTCMRAKRQCRSAFTTYKREWPSRFNCARFPRLAKNQLGVCVPPAKRAPTEPLDETKCVANTVPLCSNISHFEAFIPNMFWQSSLELISLELSQYQELVDTGCNPNLPFFLCGIYLPYCQDTATEFAVPCREVCHQVRLDCEDDLLRVYGIHWPGKFQCHRYPEASSDVQQCVHVNATEITRVPDPADEDYLDEEV